MHTDTGRQRNAPIDNITDTHTHERHSVAATCRPHSHVLQIRGPTPVMPSMLSLACAARADAKVRPTPSSPCPAAPDCCTACTAACSCAHSVSWVAPS